MRVTPLNVMRFWYRLMFPPRTPAYHRDRLNLKGDLPWEPWLHCAIWIGVIIILLFTGERGVIPPIEGFVDWTWALLGFFSPILGFFSVWMLAFNPGRARYVALWLRMVSDMGLAGAIAFYQYDRWMSELGPITDPSVAVLGNVVLFFCFWYIAALVVRDIKFIVLTEKIASCIYADPCAKELIERFTDRVGEKK